MFSPTEHVQGKSYPFTSIEEIVRLFNDLCVDIAPNSKSNFTIQTNLKK